MGAKAAARFQQTHPVSFQSTWITRVSILDRSVLIYASMRSMMIGINCSLCKYEHFYDSTVLGTQLDAHSNLAAACQAWASKVQHSKLHYSLIT